MLRFITKRLLLLIPVLGVASVLAFLITTSNTIDVVSARVVAQSDENSTDYTQQFNAEYKALHFDEPLFYFNIHSAVLPDTLYKIPSDDTRDVITALCFRYHDKGKVMQWMCLLRSCQLYCIKEEKVAKGRIDSLWISQEETIETLQSLKNLDSAEQLLTRGEKNMFIDIYTPRFDSLFAISNSLINAAPHTYIQTLIPRFVWNGTHCRFNRWMYDIGSGTFGTSLTDSNPVIDKIKQAWPTTVVIGLIALGLLFAIGITLGITHSIYRHTKWGKLIQPFLFLLHSIPNYTLATWCIILFCCGGFLCWLPTGSIGEDRFNIFQRIPYIILPVICWIAPLLSVIAAHTSAAHTDAMQSEYVLAAKAKGLSKSRILLHTLLPAIVPVVALSGILVPAILSGSVIIENIFSIPGIGKLQYEALLARDIPVVLAITILTVALSVLAQLLSDILLYLIDPRIRTTNA